MAGLVVGLCGDAIVRRETESEGMVSDVVQRGGSALAVAAEASLCTLSEAGLFDGNGAEVRSGDMMLPKGADVGAVFFTTYVGRQ